MQSSVWSYFTSHYELVVIKFLDFETHYNPIVHCHFISYHSVISVHSSHLQKLKVVSLVRNASCDEMALVDSRLSDVKKNLSKQEWI